MKVYNDGKLIAGKVRDCKGFMSMIGLRFKKSFGAYDAYLIHMVSDAILDSFFVFTPFIVVWLDEELRVLKVVNSKKDYFYAPVKNQYLVLELPMSKKGLIKKGDELQFKVNI